MEQGRYLFSIDGGGTKTEFCLFDTSTGRRESYLFGSTNYKNVGLKIADANLKDSFFKICNGQNIEVEEIIGVVIGVSGCDTAQDYDIYRSIASHMRLNPDCIYICNDSELVFLSVADKPGICAIAGTGSIAVGFDRSGQSYRCGGWGNPLSDLGSGYWIGQQVLTVWIQYCDGQRNEDPIFSKLHSFYHLENVRTPEEIPSIIAGLNHADIASCAWMLSDEAENGNLLCKDVVCRAAREVADMAAAVYRKLNLGAEEPLHMVTSGSIFKGELYRKTFQKALREKTGHPDIDYVIFDESPAQAGIRLAKRRFLMKKGGETK